MLSEFPRRQFALLYNSPVSFRVFRIVALLLSALALSHATEKTKLSYKLLSIHVKGLNHFKEDDIVSASGLKIGEFAGEAEFKRAVDKLGETGLFSNLSYAYQYSGAGCNLDLQVAENEKLVPILFDNLVWFSDNELISLLHTRLLLFGAPGYSMTGGLGRTRRRVRAVRSR